MLQAALPYAAFCSGVGVPLSDFRSLDSAHVSAKRTVRAT